MPSRGALCHTVPPEAGGKFNLIQTKCTTHIPALSNMMDLYSPPQPIVPIEKHGGPGLHLIIMRHKDRNGTA
jgi:hypothetical protein